MKKNLTYVKGKVILVTGYNRSCDFLANVGWWIQTARHRKLSNSINL